MSFALFSAGLQAAVYQRLAGDPGLEALVGTAIYDAPIGVGPVTAERGYVTLGEESVRANDTKTSQGAIHDFEVSIHSGRDGFDTAKRVAAAVCDCLVDAPLVLQQGRLVALRFLAARAERGRSPEKRKVALRFRAVVELDN